MPLAPETVEVDFITLHHPAGCGDPAWVTVPLHHACGWSYSTESDPNARTVGQEQPQTLIPPSPPGST